MAQWFGKTLTELKIAAAQKITDMAVNNISKHCKKLEIVALNCSHVTVPALVRLLKSCKKLWSLSLYCPTYNSDIIGELLQTPCELESVIIIGPYISLTAASQTY